MLPLDLETNTAVSSDVSDSVRAVLLFLVLFVEVEKDWKDESEKCGCLRWSNTELRFETENDGGPNLAIEIIENRRADGRIIPESRVVAYAIVCCGLVLIF